MKRLFIAAVLLAASLVGAQAQETESNDSTVEVIGWFCTSDTLEYCCNTIVAEIVAGDTTVTEYAWNEFRVCVTDSTKNGYTMEWVPIAVEYSDSTSAHGRLKLQAARLALGSKVMFSTDECGVFKEITNLKAVYQQSLGVQQKLVDQLYEETPTLYAKISKPEMLKQLKERLHKELGSKESAAEHYACLRMLFLNHGKVFQVGEYNVKTDNGDVYYVVTKGPTEGEEDASDREYQIFYELHLPEQDGVKSTNYYDYTYFDDGWPRRAMMTIVEDKGDKSTLTQMKLEWESKAW